MKSNPRTAGILGALATMILPLVACQSTGTDTEPSKPTVTVPLTVATLSRAPDSLVWRTPSGGGSRKVACPASSCPQTFELKAALGAKDTFFVDMWRLGVLSGTTKFVSVGGATTLQLAGSVPNLLAANLLESFSQFRTTKDSLKNADADDLVAYFAKLLLDSASAYPGATFPTGMSPAAVKQAVVLLASKRGLTNAQIQVKAIAGLPTDSVRAYVSVLVKAGTIADTTGLFPTSPLWIESAVSVGDLVQGEGPVPVKGAFGWKKPRAVAATIEIRNAQGREDSIARPVKDMLNSKDGSWSLTKNLTLQAAMGAKVGFDTLVVTLSDDSGHVLVSLTPFRVLRGDTVAPAIRLLDPPSDTSVDNAVSSFVIRVDVTDDKKVAGVKIGQKSFAAPPYLDTVDLMVGGNVIDIEARDASGNVATRKVVILRAKPAGTGADATKPVLQFTAPTGDVEVPFATDSIELAWTASDDVGVAKSTLDDRVATGAAGAYRSKQALAVGDNVFTIKAYDAAGNAASQTLHVVRRPDPVLAGIVPLPDRKVPFEQDTAQLNWTLVNPQKVTAVALDGATLVASGGVAGKTVPLAVGPNAFVLSIKDTSGKFAYDTVVLTRASDGTGPTFQWISPTKSTVVEATTTSFTLKVKATDPSGVDSVYLQGALAKSEGEGIWSAELPLPRPDGIPVVVRAQAWDKRKNTSLDTTISVTRAVPDGTEKPSIALISPAAATSNTLVFDSATLHVVAKITGLIPIDPSTVLFNATPARKDGDLYSADVPVPATGTAFSILLKASNTSKNGATLELVVTRAKDGVAPVVSIVDPIADTSLPYGTASYLVRTRASDVGSGLKSVTVNGVLVDTNGTATIPLAAGRITLIAAIATDSAGNTDTATVNATVMDIVASPTFTPPAGTYTTAQSVAIASGTSGATIYYTTDGKTPTTASLLYSAPISVSASETIKAIAVKAGLTNSTVETAEYLIKPLAGTPTFSPPPSITYLAAQNVTISTTTSGASIYYTTDGTTPTSDSKLYTAPLILGSSDTLRAIAVKPGLTNSTVGIAMYSIFDVTLKSVVLNGTMNIPVTSSALRSDSLAAFSDVAILATPTDTSASVSLSLPSPIKSLTNPTGVLITVKKGSESKIYTLALIPRQAGTFKDTRDTNSYRAVKIGSQWWMAQNLNYAGPSDALGACMLDTCAKYGRGYQALADVLAGASASQTSPSGVQGICPSGWHLPSYDEWVSLALVAGDGTDTAAGIKKLKSRADTYPWTSMVKGAGPTAVAVYTDHSGTDDFGFTMLPLQGWGTGTQGGSQSLNFSVFYTSSGLVTFYDNVSPGATTLSTRMSVRCKLD